jgi:hypothetical protein
MDLSDRLKVGVMVTLAALAESHSFRRQDCFIGERCVVRFFLSLIALVGAAVYAQPASAGPYADDLAKCFVQSSSIDDKTLFIEWMFAELSLNPAVAPLTSITDEQRAVFTRKSADYYQRLLYKDCRHQVIDGLKYEGPSAMAAGFRIIGQVAVREMMNNPNTRAGMAALTASLDKEKLVELYKEAGLAAPAAAALPAK